MWADCSRRNGSGATPRVENRSETDQRRQVLMAATKQSQPDTLQLKGGRHMCVPEVGYVCVMNPS